MKFNKCIFIVTLIVSIKLNAQQEPIFENKALLYFTNNFKRFVTHDSGFVYIDSNISHSFDSLMFLEDEHWQNKGIVTKNSYSIADSKLNSLRKEVYNLKPEQLTENKIRYKTKDIKCFDKNVICLDIFKHFYYEGYVYVYIQVKRNCRDGQEYTSALLKFDYNLELVNSLFDCFVT